MKLAILAFIFFFSGAASALSDGGKSEKSYKILAFLPFPSRSHHRVLEPLLKQLALRGHAVTVVTPLPVKEKIPNYRQIVFKDYLMEIQALLEEQAGTSDQRAFIKMNWFVHQIFIFIMRYMGTLLAEKAFTDPVIKEFMASDEKFDGVLMEAAFMQEMNIALAHKFNAVAIDVMTAGQFHWSYSLYGNPYDTSYIVDLSVPYTDQMNFWQRMHNTFNSLVIRAVYNLYYMPIYQKTMDTYVRYPGWETRPPLMEMLHNVSLVLVNSHFSLNYPYPMASHFKEIGGINIVPPNKLNKELDDWMNGAKDGVIFYSLGSNFNISRLFDEEALAELVQFFGSLKQKVLWKYDKPIANLPKNIKISNWFPQQDILAHKNCKLFITHGGFLSLSESVYHGVPMIGTPILGDQLKNVRHMEHNGYGIGLEFLNVTQASLSWAIQEIFNNPKYMTNIKKQSNLFRDKPETALETAVYWTEYVIRHKGAKHLRPAVVTMPWYRQSLIDVYAALFLLSLIPFLLFYLLIRITCKLLSCMCSSNKNRDKQIKKKVQ